MPLFSRRGYAVLANAVQQALKDQSFTIDEIDSLLNNADAAPQFLTELQLALQSPRGDTFSPKDEPETEQRSTIATEASCPATTATAGQGIMGLSLFSPDRPKLDNGEPQLLNGRAAVPSIWFEPAPEGGFLVTTMVQTSAKGYSNRHATVPSLDALGARWAADPEATLASVFDWHGWREDTQQAASANELSLEDLL